MGNCASGENPRAVSVGGIHGGYVTNNSSGSVKITNRKSPKISLDVMGGVREIKMKSASISYSLKYCYVSQRGYYPQSPHKANQDSYLVCENVGGDTGTHLFGVFDGHGETGDACSFFAADKFPTCLEKQLASVGGAKAFEEEGMEKIFVKSFIDTNRLLRRAKNIDDSLSGTTGITVTVKGDVLYVANVGDSRAIIGSTDRDGKMFASSLSNDQTPFRKDERERLKKKGALIRTIDQLEGKEQLHENWGECDVVNTGDPPRVWNSSKHIPGCAFTRSIGDAVAESVGVYAVPEILIWNLNPADKYIIIASDGVFEFLGNQQVIDLLSNNEGDLIVAAKTIVEKSYNLWLEIDQRTDDITILIISIDDIVPQQRKNTFLQSPRTPLNNSASMKISDSARLLRREMNKRRQKVISECFYFQEDEKFDVDANTTQKSADELARIERMLENNFLFKNLSMTDRDTLFRVMKKQNCSSGEIIIKEGDVGDVMYIIDDGEFMVHKLTEIESEDGSKKSMNSLLFTYTTEGATFGELSLMYGKPRGATITAKTDGHLWSISKRAFRAVLMEKKRGTLQYLQDISIFSNQRNPNLQRLSQESMVETLQENEIVCCHDVKNESWVIILILSGIIELVSHKPNTRGGKRFEGSFIVRDEVGRDFHEAFASNGTLKIAKIPQTIFLDVMGQNSLSKLITLEPQVRPNTKVFLSNDGSRCADLPFNDDERHHFTREKVAFMIGEFGYLGIFKHKDRGLSCLKVISKEKAREERIEASMVYEKEILSQMRGFIDFVPKLISSFQDEKCAYLAYQDMFVCDLSTALVYTDMSISNKVFFAACILKAVLSLHDFGIIHRFINFRSIYITTLGCAKIVDFRYCKKMDGVKSYTICGDPLFFAPEIIYQVGYDYGVDLWAYGCLVYELFDGESPFTSDQIEETKLFSIISLHRLDTLKPSERIPLNVFEMIKRLLDPLANNRLGYKNSEELLNHSCFDHIKFPTICEDTSGGVIPGDHTPDLSNLFTMENIENYSSDAFKDW